MRLVDADKLFPDVMKVDGSMAISQGQLAHVHTVEAIPKADYEARLRADKVTMLKELKQEIEELEKEADSAEFAAGWLEGVNDSLTVIKNRIDILKAVLKAKEKKDAT